ncbi:hypothetical protein VTJ49DRAFT_5807 [Mycothermus thermophilus]|uniref:3-isopropylmalate dehydrogenase n=1 Tax=Humicola insolens TaxID=85995 RepID=A0ABR3VQE8_HUMIN
MVGKVSDRVLLREGLERTDNGMKQTSWPDVAPINQKNYYTDYMKRDDQILSYRLQAEANRERLVQNAKDRDRAMNTASNGEVPLPEDDLQGDDGPATSTAFTDPSKVIVIHPGSQNLRIGFASDALPKTIPMALATRYPQTESEIHEALPRRQFEARSMDQQHGEEWSKKYQKMCNDLKVDMRANKRKVLPNSKDLVVNFNRRTEPEVISQHNDPLQVEWTDVNAPPKDGEPASSSVFIGHQALRVPDDSNPKYRVWWPIQHGWLNEDDYDTRAHLFNDLETLLDRTFRWELGLKRKADWKQYSCVIVIPDLYDKRYVELLLHLCIELFEFSRVSFIQESMAATFGAGYTQACVVDVGAQKTSITCVEDGLCIEDSRVNLKFGGYDVTETFIKMMLYDNFPYQEINLHRRYDFLLAEELKIKYCTLSQANISVQASDFHLRAPNQPTHKYQFKFYDEVILAPMGLYDPAIFDNSTKVRGRRKLIDRSYNAYDVELPDDPGSAAQLAILATIQPSVTETTIPADAAPAGTATPSKDRTNPLSFLSRNGDATGTPGTSKAPSPAPDGTSTPVPPPYVFGSSRDLGGGSPAPSARAGGTPAPANGTSVIPGTSFDGPFQSQPQQRSLKSLAAERDSVLPIAALDTAILTSIQHAAKGDEKKVRELLGSIMVIGGGAKVPHFAPFLEEKLKLRRPDLADRILVIKAIEQHSPSAGKFNLQEHLMGGASINVHNNPLTDEALAAAKAADAVLLGAIGGPEWGPSSPVRPEQGILKLRKELGTYGNLRPCSFASDSLVDRSPLKAEVCRGTDFVVVRELTGGIYFGDRTEDDGSGYALDTEPYTRAEIERVARLAGFLALARNPPAKVWSLDKANVLATSRLWRKVVSEVFAKEFPQLELGHQLIDSAAMIMVKNPRGLNGIVITSNLFGDIISDEASVIPGSIGLLPSASLGGIPDGKSKCNGIYEPIHGSAPDISGKGIVNPIGTILSVAMMLRYSLGLPKEADAVEEAVRRAIDNGTLTRDLGGNAGTGEMGDAVVAELVKLLQA